MGQPLVEREREVQALRALLDDARGGKGRTVIIQGAPGIGKTRLLGELHRWDSEPDLVRFSAVGTELERDFPFGCVRQLFEPLILRGGDKERDTLLSGDARLAEAVFRAPGTDTGPDPDPGYGVLHGLYWLTANLAERAPTVITLDDAHWSDRSSLRFLSFLGRRLDGVPVLVALTMRPTEPGARFDLLRELAHDPSTEVIDLEPLSETAVAELVRAQLPSELARRVVSVCHEATGGNPFLLRELLRELESQIRDTGDVRPDQVEALGPERVADAVIARTERIGPNAVSLAHAAATLGDGTELRIVAQLAELDRDAATTAADALAAAGILTVGRPVRFAHPIVRNAVYEGMAAAARDRWHRLAASLLVDDGASPEAVSLHLLATDPAKDPDVVELLREGARTAGSRGAPDSASRYLERALAEPPPPSLRAEVLLELGRSAESLGDPRALNWLLEAAELGKGRDAAMEAALMLVLVLSFAGRSEEALTVARRALSEGAAGEVGRKLEEWVVGFAQITPATRRPVVDLARRNLEAAQSDPNLSGGMLASAAIESALSNGNSALTARLAERATTQGLLDDQPTDDPAIFFTVGALVLVERFRAAERLFAEVLAIARTHGNLRTYSAALAFRAWLRYRQGRLSDVRADADLYPELPQPNVTDLVLAGAHLLALVDTGRLDEAAELADRIDAAPLDRTLALFQRFAEGLAALRLAQGDWTGALEATRGIAAWEEETGYSNGTWVAWRSQAALAHAALGEQARALELAEQQVSLARGFGALGMLGAALRVLGVVRSGEEAITALREANEALESSPLRLEHARAMIDLGAQLRRANDRMTAREALRDGLELARGCGADALAKRALDELVASGARPRRAATNDADALTPSERRVAEMAADGMSNKEIAQGLFVTANTVHTHLRHAYGKLGINSRSQLAERLTRPG